MSWIKGKEKMWISAKTYDLFISYKRDFAEDFASHLKSCLSKEGFRVFLDLIDIPKEFDGTAKWFQNNRLKTGIPIYVMKRNGIVSVKELWDEFKNSKFLPVIDPRIHDCCR